MKLSLVAATLAAFFLSSVEALKTHHEPERPQE
jgi:hypothetical protein